MAKLGHDVKLIPAQHVTPFVRGNKNDHNDAFAITEASQQRLKNQGSDKKKRTKKVSKTDS